jgi:hypothetical protein
VGAFLTLISATGPAGIVFVFQHRSLVEKRNGPTLLRLRRIHHIQDAFALRRGVRRSGDLFERRYRGV